MNLVEEQLIKESVYQLAGFTCRGCFQCDCELVLNTRLLNHRNRYHAYAGRDDFSAASGKDIELATEVLQDFLFLLPFFFGLLSVNVIRCIFLTVVAIISLFDLRVPSSAVPNVVGPDVSFVDAIEFNLVDTLISWCQITTFRRLLHSI